MRTGLLVVKSTGTYSHHAFFTRKTTRGNTDLLDTFVRAHTSLGLEKWRKIGETQ